MDFRIRRLIYPRLEHHCEKIGMTLRERDVGEIHGEKLFLGRLEGVCGGLLLRFQGSIAQQHDLDEKRILVLEVVIGRTDA